MSDQNSVFNLNHESNLKSVFYIFDFLIYQETAIVPRHVDNCCDVGNYSDVDNYSDIWGDITNITVYIYNIR